MAKCPKSAPELIDYLDRALLDIPHIAMTDVDLSTGELIIILSDGKRYIAAIRDGSGDES